MISSSIIKPLGKMKTIPDLSGFTGTLQYHRLSGNLKYTDGFIYLAQKVGCYWLSDIISSVQELDSIKTNEFIIWRIIVQGNTAIVTAYSDCEEDGTYTNDKLLYKQKILYTDFPRGIFEFYQINDVVLLKSEY